MSQPREVPHGAEAPVTLAFAEPVPAELPVGAAATLRPLVSCPDGRDLRGGCLTLLRGEDVLATAALIACRDGVNEAEPLSVRTPDELGAFVWTIRFPAQEIAGLAYPESTLTVASQTRPQTTSLAIWAVSSPVVAGERLALTVGAKSSAGYSLAGARVEIFDEAGAGVGRGRLGTVPWPGTEALFWTEIVLAAPPRAGIFSWSARLAATDVSPPHEGSSAAFGFAVVPRPEHRLTVTVIDAATAAPIPQVEVALGPFRTVTDAGGRACIAAPAGTFDLAVWKSGFEAAPRPIAIAADVGAEIAMVRRPSEIELWE